MKYTMKTPCDSCPFVRAHDFYLTPARVRELEDHVGGGFPCHQTVDYTGDDIDEDDPHALGRDRSKEVHCAGSLILQWKQYGGFDGIVAWSLSRRDGKSVPSDWHPETHLDLDADVYDDFDEMFDRCCELGGYDPLDEDDSRVCYGIEDDEDEDWP